MQKSTTPEQFPRLSWFGISKVVSLLKNACIKCVMEDMCFGTDIDAFDNVLDHILEDPASQACLQSGDNPMTGEQLTAGLALLKGDVGSPNNVNDVLTGDLRGILVGLFEKAAECIKAVIGDCKEAGENTCTEDTEYECSDSMQSMVNAMLSKQCLPKCVPKCPPKMPAKACKALTKKNEKKNEVSRGQFSEVLSAKQGQEQTSPNHLMVRLRHRMC